MYLRARGTVKEILFSNDYHEQFLLDCNHNKLVCTIRDEELRNLVQEGDMVKVSGKLTVVTKKKRLKTFRDNTFFVNHLEFRGEG